MAKQLVPGFVAGFVSGAVVCALGFGVFLMDRATDTVHAQTAAKSTSKVVLDNARVRVKDVTFPPGVSAGMHTHDLAHVGVIIQGGTLIFKSPDGKSETAKLETGGVGYRDANVTHEPVNPGKTPVRVIEVELK